MSRVKRRDFIAALAATPAVATTASGQERPPDSAKPSAKPVTLTLLGTGTPAPSLVRQSSGYLIEVGDDLIVWDHGPGAHQRLIESGHRSIETTHAFFTHLHYDHCMEYGRLVLQRWDQGADRIPELDVYGPPPIARMKAPPADSRPTRRSSGCGTRTATTCTCSRAASPYAAIPAARSSASSARTST